MVNQWVGMLSSWPEPPSPQQASTPERPDRADEDSSPPPKRGERAESRHWSVAGAVGTYQQTSAQEVRIAQVLPVAGTERGESAAGDVGVSPRHQILQAGRTLQEVQIAQV